MLDQTCIIQEASERIYRAYQECRLELERTFEIEKIGGVYDQLVDALLHAFVNGEGLIEENLFFILRAIRFAAKKHQFQFRKNNEATAYIYHPLAVAYSLVKIGRVRDLDIIIAGILHDTLEDTATTLEELDQLFSQKIARLVGEVTDDKSLSKQERKQLQILRAPRNSAGAAQITLADKLCNLKDLLDSPPVDWEEERIQAYFVWARQVVDRLPWVNAALKKGVDEILNYRTTF